MPKPAPDAPGREEKSSIRPAEAARLLARGVLPFSRVHDAHPLPHLPKSVKREEGEADRSADALAVQTVEANIPHLPDGAIARLSEWERFTRVQKLRVTHAKMVAEADASGDRITLNITLRLSTKRKAKATAKESRIELHKRIFSRRLRKLFPDFAFAVEDTEDGGKAHVHASIQVPRPTIDAIEFEFDGWTVTTRGMSNADLAAAYADPALEDFGKALRAALSAHFLPILTTKRDAYAPDFRDGYALDVQPNYGRRWSNYISKEVTDAAVFISRPLIRRTRDAYNALRRTHRVRVVHGLDLRPMALFAALRAVYDAYPAMPLPEAFRVAAELRDRLLPILLERRSLASKTDKAIKRGEAVERVKAMNRAEARALTLDMLTDSAPATASPEALERAGADPEAAILPFIASTATPTDPAPAPAERPASRDTAPTLATLPAHGFNALGVAGAGIQVRAPPCRYRVTPSTGRALPDNGTSGQPVRRP
jgi:hypothetical protein